MHIGENFAKCKMYMHESRIYMNKYLYTVHTLCGHTLWGRGGEERFPVLKIYWKQAERERGGGESIHGT